MNKCRSLALQSHIMNASLEQEATYKKFVDLSGTDRLIEDHFLPQFSVDLPFFSMKVFFFP